MIIFPAIDKDFFARVHKAVQKLEYEGRDQYYDAYQHFIDFFSTKDHISIQDFYIGVYFTYGWMPTIPEIKIDKEAELLQYLNAAKKENRLDITAMDNLKKSVNNSIVGVSKLLHFISPRVYPIWDSNIAAFFNDGQKTHAFQVNHINAYMRYCDFVHQVIKHEEFDDLYNKIAGHFNYAHKVTRIRAFEYCIFTFTRNQQNQKSAIINHTSENG